VLSPGWGGRSRRKPRRFAFVERLLRFWVIRGGTCDDGFPRYVSFRIIWEGRRTAWSGTGKGRSRAPQREDSYVTGFRRDEPVASG